MFDTNVICAGLSAYLMLGLLWVPVQGTFPKVA